MFSKHDPGPAAERRSFVRASQLSWALTAALLLGVAGLVAASPMALRSTTLPLNLLTLPIFGGVALVYTYLRFDIRVAAACDAVALLSGFTLIAAIYTYVTTALGAGIPYRDAQMLAADGALGLDWRGFLAWMNGHPLLGAVLDRCYQSVLEQVAVLILCRAALGQARRLQTFLLAAQICLLVCGAGPALVPAVGAYAHLGIDPARDHPAIPLTLMNGSIPQITQLRGPHPVLQLDQIDGVVVFPSFHMALAILFAWAFWRVPVLRWGALALNLAMAAATPLSGGHYFVDLIAGAALAVLAIAAATGIRRRIDAWAASPAPAGVPAGLPQI